MNNSPKKKEEALCDYLLSEYYENPPEPPNIKDDKGEIPPPDATFIKRVDKEITYWAGKKNHHSSKRFRPIVAAALMALLALSATAVAQNWTIYNFLVSFWERGVSVSNGEVESEGIYIDYSGSYVPKYIPAGFFISKRTDGTGIISLEWQTESGDIIRLDQYQTKNQLDLSKEPLDILEYVSIQGQEGILIEEKSKSRTTLMWGKKPQFVLTGSILPEEAIKIAESVSYCE